MPLMKLLFLTNLSFSMTVSIKTLFRHATFCHLTTFLVSDEGQNIMTNNNLSIYVESGNVFYQNASTNENFYSSLVAQQDKIKDIILKRISYQYSFEKYINKYLPSFSIDNIDNK